MSDPRPGPTVEHRQGGSRSATAGWILGLLFAGNLLNFYDRALPAVVLEQIKSEFRLDDAQVGVLASAFVVVAAIAGVPLGRLADRLPRTTVAGWGLVVWSLFTAAAAVLTNFWAFFITRVGVGIGEASYAPATGSLIADMYPTNRRARATALFTLGFPIGTLLAYFTAGAIAQSLDSWRAPFLVAGIPGIIVAILILRLREPARGATDPSGAVPPGRRPLRELARVRSLFGLAVAFAGYNFAAYAIGTFTTPVLQRYYGLSLVSAASVSGVIIGVMGLFGLIIGGRLCDRAAERSAAARVRLAALCLLVAAPLAYLGLAASQAALWQLVVFLSLAYLSSIVYLAASTPVVADVVRPEQRSSALGVIFALGYLLGGAAGPICVGLLSDSLAKGSSDLSADAAAAHGLQTAMMILVPLAFAVAALGMFAAARHVGRDRDAMLTASAAR